MSISFDYPTIPHLPNPGSLVHWRDLRHARCLGWEQTYGPGPFEVVHVVDRTSEEIPPGIVLKTRLGHREINSVWLVNDGDHAAG